VDTPEQPAPAPPCPQFEVALDVPTSGAMYALGRRLAGLLRAGDLVILTGDLGAGKTTLTRGIGAGLGVRGEVTSPTFMIARAHPATGPGPALVHVDAYRLNSLAEVDDLDLDATLASSVTVVEWGAGLVEELAPDRLDVLLTRPHGAFGDDPDDAMLEADEPRTVRFSGHGARWRGVRIEEVGG
jgi:tRNA threonylcarbamoyladenosine biosynthesis protein TsaE